MGRGGGKDESRAPARVRATLSSCQREDSSPSRTSRKATAKRPVAGKVSLHNSVIPTTITSMSPSGRSLTLCARTAISARIPESLSLDRCHSGLVDQDVSHRTDGHIALGHRYGRGEPVARALIDVV